MARLSCAAASVNLYGGGQNRLLRSNINSAADEFKLNIRSSSRDYIAMCVPCRLQQQRQHANGVNGVVKKLLPSICAYLVMTTGAAAVEYG